MANGNCVLGNRNETRIGALEKSDVEQWTAINQLKNRLPVWATTVISLLTFLAGVLLTMAMKK
jgi:hypothetical protein